MLDEAAPRRARGQTLVELAREDLDLYAVDELQERIAALEAEFGRVLEKLNRKQQAMAAANSIFSSS